MKNSTKTKDCFIKLRKQRKISSRTLCSILKSLRYGFEVWPLPSGHHHCYHYLYYYMSSPSPPPPPSISHHNRLFLFLHDMFRMFTRIKSRRAKTSLTFVKKTRQQKTSTNTTQHKNLLGKIL